MGFFFFLRNLREVYLLLYYPLLVPHRKFESLKPHLKLEGVPFSSPGLVVRACHLWGEGVDSGGVYTEGPLQGSLIYSRFSQMVHLWPRNLTALVPEVGDGGPRPGNPGLQPPKPVNSAPMSVPHFF